MKRFTGHDANQQVLGDIEQLVLLRDLWKVCVDETHGGLLQLFAVMCLGESQYPQGVGSVQFPAEVLAAPLDYFREAQHVGCGQGLLDVALKEWQGL